MRKFFTEPVFFLFRKSRQGSALLLTLLVVSLLLVLALSFMAAVRLEFRKIRNHQQLALARANARVGVEIAIASLQKFAGPDRRVTGTAELAGYTTQRYWTGVWSSDATDAAFSGTAGEPVWLVSGTGPAAPDMPFPAGTSVRFFPDINGFAPEEQVRVPLVELPITRAGGRYGWWVGDEGVKARVDLAAAAAPGSGMLARKLAAQSPAEPDMGALGEPWVDDHPDIWNDPDFRRRFMSRETLSLSASEIPPGVLTHALTLFSEGLPVNVRDGGFKADWSAVLDSSMVGSGLVTQYLGADPGTAVASGATTAFPFPDIRNPDRFFLSDRIGAGVAAPLPRPGPNLGILWQYGRLWREFGDGSGPVTRVYPKVETDMRSKNWVPYTSAGTLAAKRDRQHYNSPVAPILSHLRFGVRLNAEENGTSTVDGATAMYKVQLELKPLIGLWNPHNLGLEAERYLCQWFVSPYVKIRVVDPVAGTTEEYTNWLRTMWPSGSADAQKGERYMNLYIEDVDFQPGEVRLFSIDTVSDQTGDDEIENIYLTPNWNETGVVLTDFRKGNALGTSQPVLRVHRGSRIQVLEIGLQDTYYQETQDEMVLSPDYNLTWVALKAGSANHLEISRIGGLWNSGPADGTPSPSDYVVPEPFDASSLSAFLVEELPGIVPHLATWAFHLRTTTDINAANQRIRGWVDANPRAPVGNANWDDAGEFETEAGYEGWHYFPGYTGEGGNNRGLADNESPDADLNDDRYVGYLGPTSKSDAGTTHLPLFDIPTVPLTSVGQFQHAQLARYAFEPAFVAGNSYASVRIPLDQTSAPDYNGYSGFDLVDISYDVNKRIWDEIFFSTLAPDYVGGAGDWTALGSHTASLPNPRMEYVLGGSDLVDLVGTVDSNGNSRGAEALSSRVRVRGAFNVNSTSKTAWKAVLSSLGTAELPVVDPETGVLSWETPDAVRFNKFSHVLESEPYLRGAGNGPEFWKGWREISPPELGELAEAIVEEVKARGPFRSLGDFVNRDPDASDPDHRRKGALQAALDRTVNTPGSAIDSGLGDVAAKPNGSRFSDAFAGESTATGYAGYLMQGDLLQSLAPILQARSDTFVIRAYGETGNPAGPGANTWCEAVVQRVSEYTNPADMAWENPVNDTLDRVNQAFGRQFRVVSFRWLTKDEAGDLP